MRPALIVRFARYCARKTDDRGSSGEVGTINFTGQNAGSVRIFLHAGLTRVTSPDRRWQSRPMLQLAQAGGEVFAPAP